MNKKRIVGMSRLFRFELPFAAGVCVVLGEILALGTFPSFSEITLGFFSIFFISATALILNDYFDLEIDKINAPERPLPSGLVTKQDVVILSIVVAFFGFITSYLISVTAVLVVFIIWVFGFLYNWRFKRTGFLGNLMVCFSVGMTFIFGGIAVGMPYEKTVWYFGVTAMLFDLGEEIAADAMDVHGDRKAGSRSLAVLLGQEKALKISGVIFVAVVALSSVPFIFGWFEWIYLFPLSLMDGIILYSTSKLLNPHIENRRPYIRWIYLGGLSSILIFLLIRLIK